MDDDRIDLIIVNLLEWTTRLRAQRLLRIAQDKIDLSCDGFRRFWVIACHTRVSEESYLFRHYDCTSDHHYFDPSKP